MVVAMMIVVVVAAVPAEVSWSWCQLRTGNNTLCRYKCVLEEDQMEARWVQMMNIRLQTSALEYIQHREAGPQITSHTQEGVLHESFVHLPPHPSLRLENSSWRCGAWYSNFRPRDTFDSIS